MLSDREESARKSPSGAIRLVKPFTRTELDVIIWQALAVTF